MQLPAFDPDALTLWIMGPGIGELVIVRAPPGRWLVVDGCGVNGEGRAQRILDHYRARPDVVVLSHPHLDHAKGLEEVVRKATRGDRADWPLLGLALPPDSAGAGDAWDRQRGHEAGIVEQVIATMLDRWQQNPACEWRLIEQSSVPLGDAEIHVLSPHWRILASARARYLNGKRFDPNRVASALLVKWRGRSALLGSDLPERPGKAWSRATRARPDLASHDVYKIAHHGSDNALGPQLPSGGVARMWVATPYSSSGLPCFDDGDGLASILDHETPVALTGLPRAYAEQHRDIGRWSRAQLRDATDLGIESPPIGFPDCFVMVTLPQQGPPQATLGPGASEITR